MNTTITIALIDLLDNQIVSNQTSKYPQSDPMRNIPRPKRHRLMQDSLIPNPNNLPLSPLYYELTHKAPNIPPPTYITHMYHDLRLRSLILAIPIPIPL